MLRFAGALAVFMLSIGNAAWAGPPVPDVNVINTPSVNSQVRTVRLLEVAATGFTFAAPYEANLDVSLYSKVMVKLVCIDPGVHVAVYDNLDELVGDVTCSTPVTFDILATWLRIVATGSPQVEGTSSAVIHVYARP